MLDYDKEADAYDVTRGGEPRAAAAADAVLSLIPAQTRRLLDVACGTGIVTRRFAAARPATRVWGADLTYGMARMAAVRLPGAVVLADGRALPYPDGVFDAVTSVWLLHLLDRPEDVRAVVAECARVLRPGGVYVTTVDKAAAHDVGSDIDAVLAPRPRRPAPDAAPLVESYAAAHFLHPAGQARFPGQGRSPRRTAADLRRGWFTRLPPGDPLTERFAVRLEALPDQELPRPEPVFSIRAFRKAG
ncbi:methyltransferase domain-containing protein [Streptomyces canus]|uniref:class I SAM-dependent methyltransferase n=1 Tax=Streptomyces canus TaxID=58343 RepID=UPI003684CF18